MSILIENLSKQYQNKWVLNHLHLEIKTGDLIALIGPSGSGKSTLLRLIAGFEKPDEGYIWLGGQNAENLHIQERQIGFVFQDYALFPHLTVFENIAFGLNIRHFSLSAIQARIQELLQLVQLDKMQNFYPHQLSGGQKQRVALARALSIEPKVLLLDEPFGALDIQVRKDLRKWIAKFHKDIPVTTIFVTHDQNEALELAHEIVLFNKGVIEQMGSPTDCLENPATEFVRQFLLLTN